MHEFEVEQKFRVDDLTELRQRIESAFDIDSSNTYHQSDCYFAHPVRDFGETDESLRVRQTVVQKDDSSACTTRVTYKGPRIDTDGTGQEFKTRREIELECGALPADAEKMKELFSTLGFRQAGTVLKSRQCLKAIWQEFNVEFALDDVTDLGQFAEIEILAGPDKLEKAQQAISKLASTLELTDPITSSYRNMLYG